MNTATPQTDAPAVGMPYGVLAQTNPDYAKNAAWWTDLDLLYKGGNELAENVERFLPQLVGEHALRYEERKRSAGYINYLAQVIDYFGGSLFAEPISVTPPSDAADAATPGQQPAVPEVYKLFERDADTQQTPFAGLLKDITTTALLKRWTWIAIDLPPRSVVEPASLAEEQSTGQLRPYAYEVAPEGVLDWKEADHGGLEWAIVRRILNERTAPESTRALVTEEFTVWRRAAVLVSSQDGRDDEAATGPVTFERYAVTYPVGQKPQAAQTVPLVASGSTSFLRIPLLRFQLKEGMWIGNLIGKLVQEHFARRSTMVSTANQSLVEIPLAKLGSETPSFQGDIPSEVVDNPRRGDDPVGQFKRAVFMCIGANDDVSFVSPNGKASAFTAQDLKELKDEIFRVVRQMSASAGATPTSIGRSGLSKQMDRDSEAIILGALGEKVRAFAVAIYTTISEALGDRVMWTPHGLEEFAGNDREALFGEAMQIDLLNIPSRTFKQTLKTQVALKLVGNVPPETKAVIQQEIEEGVEHEQEIADLHQDAAKELAKNPIPPAPDSSSSEVTDADEDDAPPSDGR